MAKDIAGSSVRRSARTASGTEEEEKKENFTLEEEEKKRTSSAFVRASCHAALSRVSE